VEVAGWRQWVVSSEEVEAKIRLVMESEEVERIRARVTAHKEAAAVAWKSGRTAGRHVLRSASSCRTRACQGTGKTRVMQSALC
jgi:hypothetical protein